jgi:chaperone modulatory protein CbpM
MGGADIPDSAAVPDEDAWFSLAELAERSGLSPAQIQELLEAGLLQEASLSGAAWSFRAGSLVWARRAGRLRADFDLNDAGTLLALTLIQRIEALEARLRELECQLLRE